ncbi:MAG: 23S rRNA (guanosine(2251)-2'-O)-methyltransferase RlmB [Bacteroidota bacterium]
MKKNKDKMIYGRHPVLEALQSGTPIDKLLLQQGVRGDFERDIRHWSKRLNIPLQVAPKERLNRITSGNHQGIIGYLSLLTYQRLEDVLPLIYERSESPLLVLLDGVTDVRNFGAIARSAECCGAHALVIPKKGAAQINAEALKTSAGALNVIPVCREKSLIKAIESLQLAGVRVMASSLAAREPLDQLDLMGPVALVVGAEGDGVSRAVLQAVDQTFVIPQKGQTDSFNVSVASGIMLYEVMRQRG